MSVGLDIGSKTIKVVELKESGGKHALRAAGTVGYSGVDLERVEDDKALAGLAATIKNLFKDAKVNSKNVSLAISETNAFTRLLKFPLLSDQEVASAVKWEAEEYIPIPLKEAVTEHVVLERQEEGNPPQVLVLLVAVARNLIEKYVKVANLAGLSVVGVETELLSIIRSVAPDSGTMVLVDFGARSTDIAISKNKNLYFSRSIPTAGEAFTRAVSQSLGVSVKQAEEYKRAYGLATEQLEGKVASALRPIFKVVAEEIKKAIHYFQLEVKGNKPNSVILTGGTSGLPGASASLTKLLGMEVVVGNPFSKISVDPSSSKSLVGYAPLYTVSVGLAMRKD